MEATTTGPPPSTGNPCSECGSEEVIVTKARKAYCKNCWRYHCEFRFRKRLFELGRPAKGTVGEVFRPAEQVLICYDGSPTSVALINLALNAMDFGTSQDEGGPGSNLPFPFRFSILVLLESELNGSPGVEGRQKKHLQSLLKWTQTAAKQVGFQFPLFTSCIEMSLRDFHDADHNGLMMNEAELLVRLIDSGNSETEAFAEVTNSEVDSLRLPFHESLDYHLMELRKSLKTKTEDKDFITILKRNLTYRIAHDLKISRILVPEDQTSLAVKMFTMMSLGRGSQVADEMSFTSTIENGIVVARPLIDFSDDDLRGYLETLGEEYTDGMVNKGSNAKRKMKIDSVDRQCDDFIVNLQRGYPATVSTLTRIGSKLQPSSDASTSEAGDVSCTRCRFCKRQSESASSECNLCYGCQHFLNDVHPDKKEYFKNLFSLKASSSEAS